MIRLDGLSVRVGEFLLEDISFEVPSGGYGLLIGPSGSGKTTLLETVAGHVPPLRGRVQLHGEDVSDRAPEGRGVGFVYQNYHLFPHLDVRENIQYGLRRGPFPPTEQLARVRELAALLGIESLLDRSIHGLSGGETQRVALARALAPRPSILLLDEPFAAVDPATRHMLRRELRAIHTHEKVTILQVTHDFDEALRLGDVVAVLAEGRIAQLGRPDEVFRFPNSAFVARFIGTGTVLRGEVSRQAPGSDSPFSAWFESGPLRFEVVAEREGGAHAVLRPEDLTLSREPILGSARNRFAAVVNRVERVGPVSYVHLDAGHPLTAAVTTASAAELGLDQWRRSRRDRQGDRHPSGVGLSGDHPFPACRSRRLLRGGLPPAPPRAAGGGPPHRWGAAEGAWRGAIRVVWCPGLRCPGGNVVERGGASLPRRDLRADLVRRLPPRVPHRPTGVPGILSPGGHGVARRGLPRFLRDGPTLPDVAPP